MFRQVYLRFVGPSSVVLDVGGWIGVTALWLAGVARKVVVLEPTDTAFEEMALNVQQNLDRCGRLSLVRAALSSRRGFIRMTDRGDSADQRDTFDSKIGSVTVATQRIDDLLLSHPELRQTSFMKVDAEGSERFIIPSIVPFLRDVQPTLFLSLHPWVLRYGELKIILEILHTLCPCLYGFEPSRSPGGGLARLLDSDLEARLNRHSGFAPNERPKASDPADDIICTWEPLVGIAESR